MIVEEANDFLSRREVQRLLQSLKNGAVDWLKPQFRDISGVTYPDAMRIMGVEARQANAILNHLVELGLLTRELSETRFSCPSCNSIYFIMRTICPNCGSSLGRRGEMIEHLHCGYIDFAEKFIESNDKVCPLCRRYLKALGLDYLKPGIFYKCPSCGDLVDQNSKISFACVECGKEFLEGQEALIEGYIYKIVKDKTGLVDRHCVDLTPIIEKLKSTGWEAKISASLKGISGIEHKFDLLAFMARNKVQEGKPDVVADVEIRNSPLDEGVILHCFAKVNDVKAKHMVLVAVPGLSENAAKLAKFFKIHVSDCSSPLSVGTVLLRTLQTHLLPTDKPFFFYRNINSDAGLVATTVAELHDVLDKVELNSIEFHLYRGDFENWLKDVFQASRLASRIAGIRSNGLRGNQLRDELKKAVEEWLESPASM